jgi:uronate dehydrogenase
MKRILITGAAGNIGSALRKGFHGSYPLIRLLDIAPLAAAEKDEELCAADIRDAAALDKAMAGIDCVVHLAGMPTEAPWEQVLRLNIEGCYNVFEAARRGGVKRIVFASSNHAIGFHRRERSIDTNVVPRPDTRYGVSKVFGEALGRLYADKYGLSVACLRIGSFLTPDRPTDARQLLTWISHRDMVQLVRRCIDCPDYHFVIVYGVSNNLRSRWDNSKVKFLGYRPEDDSEMFAAEILALGKQENEIAAQFHGGFYTPIEFAGNTAKID